MSETRATVRAISGELIAGTMSVDEAATALQGITGTSTVHDHQTAEELFTCMLNDPEVGDDNDVDYLASACDMHKITYDEMARLTAVITPLK
jgi:hypothetical protein